jgi:hypothetical protein
MNLAVPGANTRTGAREYADSPLHLRSKNREGEMKSWLVVSVGVMAGFTVSAVADDGPGSSQRFFRTELVGFNEVPSVSSPAGGQFHAMVNETNTAFTYWLTYSGLTADAAQSHIHFGQHHTNGGISVWLCEGTVAAPAGVAANVPACAPRSTTIPLTATVTAADVIGPAGQGISPTEFAELLRAMRAGAAYANVHSGVPGNPNATPPTPTVGFPGGEIRGQIH